MTPQELAQVGLSLSVTDGVATLTLDRPEVRNAQTPDMWLALGQVGEDLLADEAVRVVVLRGAGAGFSAGLDRSVLAPTAPTPGQPARESVLDLLALDDAGMADRIEVYQRGFTWLRDPRIVSVAVVHGHAVGAGFQLALSCDLRLLADDASFSMKEAALGLVPDLTGTLPLVQAAGYARALELCTTARTVDAGEALRLGLALDVVPADDLDGALATLVGALTATPAANARAVKTILRAAVPGDLDAQRRVEREHQVGRFRELAALMAAR
ncbi:enoyl-CoA hydratase/isomerase family protein [Nocardioides bruguierae]|uniref:enoyl-CoA hydratase/isomerase family protein n=1 Tax=Nocardioides bruguierae TaxID=2945102 RepID=UPI00202188E8|nr:enoyl-CoA hydratase/isomerase family protein [Nocardioides bruguierae]MCL8024458.1 enoyl-CoA hydratase/isomerase family protein [Nocardioides bruguierae]